MLMPVLAAGRAGGAVGGMWSIVALRAVVVLSTAMVRGAGVGWEGTGVALEGAGVGCEGDCVGFDGGSFAATVTPACSGAASGFGFTCFAAEAVSVTAGLVGRGVAGDPKAPAI